MRRDNCEFVRTTMTIALDMILKESNVKGAIEYVKHRVSDLLQNKLDLSQMIMTSGSQNQRRTHAYNDHQVSANMCMTS